MAAVSARAQVYLVRPSWLRVSMKTGGGGLFCGQGDLSLAHQDLHWGKQYFGLPLL